jgi:osmotically-inducible protein OsmY
MCVVARAERDEQPEALMADEDDPVRVRTPFGLRGSRQRQQHVSSALDWDPSVDATEVGVTVENGVVTLRSDVRSYAEKEAADRVTLRVYGVKAVANDLRVRLASGYERSDSEIAQAAVNALKWHASVPENRITISVRDGQVILKGTVDWQFQKDAVARVIRDLTAVRGVTNHIAVTPHAKPSEIQTRSKRRSDAAPRSMRAGSASPWRTARSS